MPRHLKNKIDKRLFQKLEAKTLLSIDYKYLLATHISMFVE
jgi:hypothetical protein